MPFITRNICSTVWRNTLQCTGPTVEQANGNCSEQEENPFAPCRSFGAPLERRWSSFGATSDQLEGFGRRAHLPMDPSAEPKSSARWLTPTPYHIPSFSPCCLLQSSNGGSGSVQHRVGTGRGQVTGTRHARDTAQTVGQPRLTRGTEPMHHAVPEML